MERSKTAEATETAAATTTAMTTMTLECTASAGRGVPAGLVGRGFSEPAKDRLSGSSSSK